MFIVLIFLPDKSYADNYRLRQHYDALKPVLQSNIYGIPIYIASSDQNHVMQGDVYGILPHPFETLRHALTTAATWCDIMPQHFNIKDCTYQTLKQHCQLTIYTGRKFYEAPEDVYQLKYQFNLLSNTKNYFQEILSADSGPIGTSDYRIEVEAIPLENDRTFIHFRYRYRDSFFTRLGMKTYLATLGRNKIGFTVLEQDKDGKPVYVEGTRGIIERNAVRYYFAIQSYLDTEKVQAKQRLLKRLNRWFDLTERYPKQLHELDRKTYLEAKQQEWQDQIKLQQALPAPDETHGACQP